MSVLTTQARSPIPTRLGVIRGTRAVSTLAYVGALKAWVRVGRWAAAASTAAPAAAAATEGGIPFLSG